MSRRAMHIIGLLLGLVLAGCVVAAAAAFDQAQRTETRRQADRVRSDAEIARVARRVFRLEAPTEAELRTIVIRRLRVCARDRQCRALFTATAPPGPPGERGMRGRTPGRKQVLAAVQRYCARHNRCRGAPGSSGGRGKRGVPGESIQGPPGAQGEAAPGPTDEQIAAAVREYCTARRGNCTLFPLPKLLP